MNEHTRKLLDDARKKKFDDILINLEYNDININASDNEGRTVLHYATKHAHVTIICKILEDSDVNINIQYNSG